MMVSLISMERIIVGAIGVSIILCGSAGLSDARKIKRSGSVEIDGATRGQIYFPIEILCHAHRRVRTEMQMSWMQKAIWGSLNLAPIDRLYETK
jgi:hypothetical protein